MIDTLLNDESKVTASRRYIANYAVFHGCMKSGLGRNLIVCSENCNLSVPFLICGGFSKALVLKIVNSRISPTY